MAQQHYHLDTGEVQDESPRYREGDRTETALLLALRRGCPVKRKVTEHVGTIDGVAFSTKTIDEAFAMLRWQGYVDQTNRLVEQPSGWEQIFRAA